MKKSTSKSDHWRLLVKIGLQVRKISIFMLTCAFTTFSLQSFSNPVIGREKDNSIGLIILIDVTGRIVDKDGQPIPGATIRVKSGKGATTSDNDGRFTLKNVTAGNILIISYQGFVQREIPASFDLSAIQLLVSENELNEVVVVGYGTTQKKDLTGSVSTVSSAQIRDLPVSSIDQKLTGQIAGVQISAPTGAPGGGVSVRIRGTGSITAGNNPLYVVDGFAISNTGGQVYNPLNVIS
ncbi:MAG: hypothetical protein EOO92_19275, partial [Pedobacter sp.]